MGDPLHLSQFRVFFPWERIAIDIENPGQIKPLILPAAVSLVIGWTVWNVIYNLYFHPLAKFPGPKLAAISPIWISIRNLAGRTPFDYAQAHKKYGPIVRVAPNELSVSDAGAWKEIYGHNPRNKTFLKSEFYETKELEFGLTHIVTERDPAVHGVMRRMLSHAFSTKALMEQEGSIHYYIDLLVTRLGQRYAGKERGPDGEYCNLVTWYNYTTFDIIGDLAFGDAVGFGCLKEQKAHKWVSTILDAIYLTPLHDTFRRYPGLLKLGFWMTPKSLMDKKQMINDYSKEVVARRLAIETDRKDFWQYILNREESKGLSVEEFAVQAQLLIIAGSETTATQLSGLSYYLHKNSRVLNKLKDEIRSTFKNYSEITSQNTISLQYLNAVIEEGLRLYPPVPIGLPRESPGAVVAGHYIPRGTDISVPSFTVTRDPAFWTRPDELVPERWIDTKNTDKKEASQPFSLGPRVCLGKNLAYMELRLILAKLIYAYDFEMIEPDLDWEGKSRVYALWSKPELNMRVKRRPGVQWRDGEEGPIPV